MQNYDIVDDGVTRTLIIGKNKYTTPYSAKIIEAIVARKGVERAPQYLKHKEERSHYLVPLFKHLNAGAKNLRVLEVGCSSGHITEFLNEQPCISEIYSFDVDKGLVDIAKIKKDELGLSKVKRIDCLTNAESRNLPYPENSFDLVIALAVVEHLPLENRHEYVDAYYRKLKTGGLIGFFETPNRLFPFEKHTVGLPFISRMSPQTAYIYAKLCGKLKGVSFPQFSRYDTGWLNVTYHELLPRTNMIDVEDISEQLGYGYYFGFADRLSTRLAFAPLRAASRLLGFPTSFYLPTFNLVFRKTKDLEAVQPA